MIRLIELFAGIGSQAKALENLEIDFEHYRAIEFDKYAMTSYNAIHGTNFETSDITKINGADLGIINTNEYQYIMTYSFPCQDLSVAGNQAGMKKGTGTRSGLLWEVERLLNECKELPQILLMENVPQVHSKKNKPDFNKWIEFLESKGYTNYCDDLNAKNYGIPQNRNRCFMVSLLDGINFEFSKPFELKIKLKDILEEDVDEEKYYLNNRQIERMQTSSYIQNQKRIQNKDYCDTLCARDYKGPKCVQVSNIKLSNYESINKVYSTDRISPALNTSQSAHRQPKIIIDELIKPSVRKTFEREKYEIAKTDKEIYQCKCESGYQDKKVGIKVSPTLRAGNSHTCILNNFRIRKLTPKEYWRLMGFNDTDFNNAKQSLCDTYYKGKDKANSQLYK